MAKMPGFIWPVEFCGVIGRKKLASYYLSRDCIDVQRRSELMEKIVEEKVE